MLIDIHTETDRGDILTLQQDLRIIWKGLVLVVPAGFESDGASVPRFLWDSVTPAVDPRTIRAAIVHDYLYRHTPGGWSRKMADDLFYDLMREDGTGFLTAQTAYWGVRFFGSSSWRANE